MFGCQNRQRQARTLRNARDECLRIKREAETANDQTAPVNALRTVEQQLAVIEMWLTGELRGSGATKASSELHDEDAADKLALALGMEEGLASSERHDKFSEIFFPPLERERLIKDFTCEAKSLNFKHLGRIYLSSERICFTATVMGVTVSFRVLWKHCGTIRLRPAVEGSKGHVLRLRFKAGHKTEFDGDFVESVDMEVFDQLALGALHSCADHFLGSGLFDLQGSGSELLLEQGVGRLSMRAPSFVGDTRQNVADFLRRSIVWEVERKGGLISGAWSTPWLPHDTSCKKRWVSIEEAYHTHHLLPPDLSITACTAASTPPIPTVDFLGRARNCSWQVVLDSSDSDSEGWQYAYEFFKDPKKWHSAAFPGASVRRRRWKPAFQKEAECVHNQKKSTGFKTQEPRSSVMIDVNDGKRHDTELLKLDLGAVPLAKLAECFEANAWFEEGCLMYKKFMEAQAQEVDLGDWVEDEGIAQKLKGKVRTLSLRVALPPAPLCPETTRMKVTYHVYATESRIILETTTMSLDVPYGETFTIAICDVFTVVHGHVQLVRHCGIEWLQSNWMKGVLETMVRGQARTDAERFAELVKAHFLT